MAFDVFIAMESQINLEHLLSGNPEQVSFTNVLETRPDVLCGVRLLLD